MKKFLTYISISFLLSLIIVGCSRKKDKFLNKNFHSLTTKYNFLFNGNNLYAEGLIDLENDLRENFWTLLPVEKFKFYDADEDERDTNVTKAEEMEKDYERKIKEANAWRPTLRYSSPSLSNLCNSCAT